MTVRVVGALRRTMGIAARRGPRRATPVFLATLLVACAAKELPVDQDLTLKFMDPNTPYKVDIGDGVQHDIEMGSTEVHVRVSGGPVTQITVTAYGGNGKPCGTATIYIEPNQHVYDVTVTCKWDDGGAPPDTAPAPGPDAGPDITPDTGPSLVCQDYCRAMADHCPGVYPISPQECLDTCTAFGWDPGSVPATASNTVQCRIDSALKAPVPDDLLWCYRAGPTGGRRCGSLWFNFCEAAARNCPSLLPGGTLESCKLAGMDPAATPALRSDKGNTLECRIFWIGEAGKDGGKSCALAVEGAPDSPCHD